MDEIDITGRDSYIIEKALFFAAHFIDGMPILHRQISDRSDMVLILRAKLGDSYLKVADNYSKALEEITGRPFDIEEY